MSFRSLASQAKFREFSYVEVGLDGLDWSRLDGKGERDREKNRLKEVGVGVSEW